MRRRHVFFILVQFSSGGGETACESARPALLRRGGPRAPSVHTDKHRMVRRIRGGGGAYRAEGVARTRDAVLERRWPAARGGEQNSEGVRCATSMPRRLDRSLGIGVERIATKMSERREEGGRGRWACERSMGGGSKPPSRRTEEAIVTFRMGQVQVEGCGDCAASLR